MMNSGICVCFVNRTFYPIFSGRAIFIQKIIRKLRQRGVETCVLTARVNNLPKYECIDGVEVYRVPVVDRGRLAIRLTSFAFSCFVFMLLKGRKYNIIHLSGIWFSSVLFKLLGKKTIFDMTLLGNDDPQGIQSKFGRFGLKLYASADYFVSTSTAMRESYHKTNLPGWKLFQIPRATDPEIFQPVESEQKQVIRRKLGLSQAEKIVISVGGIKKRKGIDFLIDAWALVCTQHQDSCLLLVGPFSEPDFLLELQGKIQQHRMQDRVCFVGKVDNVVEYLGASDVFAFCSHREGLPNALIEAMSCGLPCVVSRIKGITDDIIDHHVDGIVVENRDVDEYAKVLLEVLRDDVLAHQLGRHARRKVLKKFSIDVICDQYMELYRKLTS